MNGARFCAITFLGAIIVMALGLIFGKFSPPPTTLSSVDEVARIYQAHSNQLLIKSMALIFGVLLWLPVCCGLSLAMMRMNPRSAFLAFLQFTGGIFALIGPFMAGLVIMTAVIRSDNSPSVIAAMNDFGVILIVASTLGAVFQGGALGVAILRDTSPNPILPQWLAWISIAWGIMAQGGVFSAFFETGPLSSTGVIGLMLPMTSLVLWMIAVVIALFRIKPAQWASGEPA